MEATESSAVDTTYSPRNKSATRSPSSTKTLDVGDVLLERFMLMREIGSGGSSRVFRARDLLAVLGGNLKESDIAVKVVTLSERENGIDGSSLLLRETLTTRHLSHPNILKIYDYHRDGSHVFVTMELVDGEPLSDLTKLHPDGVLDYKRVISIIDPVVTGIGAAHRAGIVHSDIKPANILLANDGSVKVIDFATARTKLQKTSSEADAEIAQPGYHAYTLAYASPQLLKDAAPSIGDDIYSLACVIYELLGGKQANASTVSKKVANISGGKSKPKQSRQISYRPNIERTKPACINHRQWQVLRLAMTEQGCKKFKSIDEFWIKFKRERSLPYISLATIITVALLTAAGVYAAQNLPLPQITFTRDTQPSVVETSKVEEPKTLSGLPIEQKIEHLFKLRENINKQDPTHSTEQTASWLSQLALEQPEILAVLTNITSETLNYDTAALEAPQFDSTYQLLNLAQSVYPDSHAIYELKDSIQNEKDQFIAFLLVEYANLWAAPSRSIPSAIEINSVLRNFRLLNFDAPSTSDQHSQQILANLKRAIAEADYGKYFQLHAFAQSITEHPVLIDALNQFDQSYYNNAEKLMDYAASEADQQQEYPAKAAKQWIKPRLVALNTKLTKARKDNEIIEIDGELAALAADYKTDISNPIFDETLTLLVKKYNTKINFYKSRGYLNSLTILQASLNKLPIDKQ